MLMNQPLGRVVKLEYRDLNPKVAADTSAFVVHFRAPDGDYYEYPLNNPQWSIQNPTLQFMALNGFQPTDLDGSTDTKDWQWLIPIAPNGEGGYGLAANVLDGGAEALEEAEWFSPLDDEKATHGDHSGPQSGPGPDPGTGNRGGVDHDEKGGVTAELTPDENTGVNLTVE